MIMSMGFWGPNKPVTRSYTPKTKSETNGAVLLLYAISAICNGGPCYQSNVRENTESTAVIYNVLEFSPPKVQLEGWFGN